MKAIDIRCFPQYEAKGPEADELRQIVAEALDECGSESSGFDPEDEEFFASRPGDFEVGIK